MASTKCKLEHIAELTGKGSSSTELSESYQSSFHQGTKIEFGPYHGTLPSLSLHPALEIKQSGYTTTSNLQSQTPYQLPYQTKYKPTPPLSPLLH